MYLRHIDLHKTNDGQVLVMLLCFVCLSGKCSNTATVLLHVQWLYQITTKFQLCTCMQLMGYAQFNYSTILPLFMPTTTTYLQLSTQSSPKHPCFGVLREKALFFLLPFPILGAQPTNKCIQQLQDFLDIPHIWIKVIQQCPIGCLCQSHKHFFN